MCLWWIYYISKVLATFWEHPCAEYAVLFVELAIINILILHKVHTSWKLKWTKNKKQIKPKFNV